MCIWPSRPILRELPVRVCHQIHNRLVGLHELGYLAVKDVPTSADFSFTYTPTLTTLFRFSALTFNGHHIHLDKEYAQEKEGYPGPLS